jgi:hypothetical protein
MGHLTVPTLVVLAEGISIEAFDADAHLLGWPHEIVKVKQLNGDYVIMAILFLREAGNRPTKRRV